MTIMMLAIGIWCSVMMVGYRDSAQFNNSIMMKRIIKSKCFLDQSSVSGRQFQHLPGNWPRCKSPCRKFPCRPLSQIPLSSPCLKFPCHKLSQMLISASIPLHPDPDLTRLVFSVPDGKLLLDYIRNVSFTSLSTDLFFNLGSSIIAPLTPNFW